MDSSFVPSLIALRNATPDAVIEKLHNAFSTITKMDADQVVAAYQTTLTVAKGMNIPDDPMVQTLLAALRAQMTALMTSVNGQRMIGRFKLVTGMEVTGLHFCS